jgi:hypothetical protein
MMMNVEQSVEWELAGETEVLGENLHQCHFAHIPHDLTRALTRAAAVGSRRLTAWTMARPGHYAKSQNVAGSIPDVIGFFNVPNPSSRTVDLDSTQPLTELITRNLPGGKGWSAHKADNLTAICELIV